MLPGLKAVLNIHPMLVHFPLALWLGALFFEIVAVIRGSEDWHRTAARLLYLGTVAGIVTVMSGLAAEKSVPAGPAMIVVGIHKTLMMLTTSLAVALSLFALIFRKNFTAAYRKYLLAGLIAMGILMALGGDRGAQLVYQFGTAVDWSSAQQQK
jgi:uncharacterized membrane protein